MRGPSRRSGAQEPDLEILPPEPFPGPDDQHPRTDAPQAPRRRRPPIPLLVAAAAAAVVAGGLAAASGHRHHRVLPPPPTTTLPVTASPPSSSGGLAVVTVVVVLGDKIVERRLDGRPAGGPIGLFRPVAASSARGRVLDIIGRTLVAQGTDVSEAGGGRVGTWAYDLDGGRPPRFLGASSGFVPASVGGRVWIAVGATVSEVDVDSGATTNGPYPVSGELVASVGEGLVLQRGDRVVWRLPFAAAGGRSDLGVDVGAGRALGGAGRRVLWQVDDGAVALTDVPGGGRVTSTAPLDRSRSPRLAALSPGGTWVALGSSSAAVVAFTDPAPGQRYQAFGPLSDLSWIDDHRLVVRQGPRHIQVVDAARGTVVDLSDLPADAEGLVVDRVPG